MGRDRRVYKALDKESTHCWIYRTLTTAKRQMPGYNEAKAKTFADARVTFTEEQVRKETALPSAAVRQRSTSICASAAVCAPPSASLTRST